MKSWKTYAIIILAAIAIFLFWKGCKNKPVQTYDPRHAIDSISKLKTIDSIRHAEDANKLQSALEFADMAKELYINAMLNDESKIKYLNRVISSLKKDSGYTIYELSCDSLNEITKRYLPLVDSFRNAVRVSDSLYEQLHASCDTLVNDYDRAYNALKDVALKSAETIKSLQPRGQVYLGVSGQSNLIYTAGGAELIYKDKRDRMYKVGYLIGNTKPIYQVGVAVKVKFGR